MRTVPQSPCASSFLSPLFSRNIVGIEYLPLRAAMLVSNSPILAYLGGGGQLTPEVHVQLKLRWPGPILRESRGLPVSTV